MLGAGGEREVGESHVVPGQRARVAQRQGYPNPVEKDCLVHRVAQIIAVDHWLGERVVARQSKAA